MDFRPQVADLFGLADGAQVIVGNGFVDTFGGIAVGTTGMARDHAIALE